MLSRMSGLRGFQIMYCTHWSRENVVSFNASKMAFDNLDAHIHGTALSGVTISLTLANS